jgi:hypothetical protein
MAPRSPPEPTTRQKTPIVLSAHQTKREPKPDLMHPFGPRTNKNRLSSRLPPLQTSIGRLARKQRPLPLLS